ncbi:MAG TPA: DUF3857 domain-containing protein [Bryobacteraceae bacterium]|nr:DUF3857 domain-containing protein [Bryobacteraceae bacterium]
MRRALGLLFLAASAAVAADDVPSWLKDLTAVKLPAYERKISAVMLLNEEQDAVGQNGRVTTTTRMAIFYLTRVGVDIRFSDQYDTSSGKVRDFRAWTIASTGKVKKYGKDEILDVACADNDVYNECRRRLVSGRADAEPGAIFAYESVIERQLFSNQLMFHFQDRFPVRLARFTVTPPPEMEVSAIPFNGAPAVASAGRGAFTWQMENLAAIEPEAASPSLLTLTPWVGVNLIPAGQKSTSWPEAARQLAALNDGVAEPNEALAAKARSLVAGLTSELDKIRAIGRFTQQVNYVSVQVNLAKGGGYRPHAANDVFQKLYGDCKDKANLTRAMLKAVGIVAYPVAIYSGDRTHVTEQWASLGAFNHAVSAIRVGSETTAPAVLDDPHMGRLLFFDPTDPYTPPGFIPDHEQGSLALIGIPETGGLVRVPAATALAASRERTVEATLAADGSLSGTFVDRRSGEALPAAVSAYRGLSRADYTKSVERWLAASVPGALSNGIEVSDSDGSFVLKGEFKAQRYGQLPQARLLTARAAPLRHYDTLSLNSKTRVWPIVMDSDILSETVRLTLPDGFKVDEMPPAVHLNSPFGMFEASWKLENPSVIVFHRTVEIPAQSVPASQYAELRKFLEMVRGAAEEPVILVK